MFLCLSLASVALITSVQSSARIRGLKPDFRVKIFLFLSRHNRWQWTCFCDLQSDNHSQNKFNLCCCWSIYIPKKFAKQLGFPLFAEIKFSRFNLTWRTAAKEVNLHTAQEDKLFQVGRQSSEKWRDFHLGNPTHPMHNPTTQWSNCVEIPAGTRVYISVWHCQHFLRSSPLIDSFHCPTKQRWAGADTCQRRYRCQGYFTN